MGIDFSRVCDKYADRKRVVIDVLQDKTIVWAPSGLEILKKMHEHESGLLDITLFSDFNILIFESLASELTKVKSGIYKTPNAITARAHAVLKSDQTVVVWGDADFGGNAIGTDLTNVVRVFSNDMSFAALKSDQTVVAWGPAYSGGDATGVDLSNVVRVFSNLYAFAALKSDQTVVAWGGENDIDKVRQLAEDSE